MWLRKMFIFILIFNFCNECEKKKTPIIYVIEIFWILRILIFLLNVLVESDPQSSDAFAFPVVLSYEIPTLFSCCYIKKTGIRILLISGVLINRGSDYIETMCL